MATKPKDASRHHGAFGRMRLRHDGRITRGNGAVYHHFEMTNKHSRWATNGLGKLRAHLTRDGYEEVGSDERLDNQGVPHARTHVFRKGDDEVRIDTFLTGPAGGTEHVRSVAHFPDGTAGDGRNRLTLGQIASAMSWGMVPA